MARRWKASTKVRSRTFLASVSSVTRTSLVWSPGSEWNAIRAAQQLKAQWSKAATLPDQAKLWEHVRNTKVIQDQVTSDTGSTKDALAGDGKKISATYDFAGEPAWLDRSVLCDLGIQGRQADIVVGLAGIDARAAQATCADVCAYRRTMSAASMSKALAAMAATAMKMPPGDAAILSKAVGKPVRVQWSRADEHGWEPMGPPTLIDIQGGDGFLGQCFGAGIRFLHSAADRRQFPCAAHRRHTRRPAAKGRHRPRQRIFQNSAIPYKFANVRTVCRRLENTVFRPSWIRTPGRMQNTYANESFMDELAAAAKADPIAFRKKYLDDKARPRTDRPAGCALEMGDAARRAAGLVGQCR